MQALFAVGVDPDKICIQKEGESEMDIDAVDIAFLKTNWNGWYERLPAPLADSAVHHLTHRVTKRPKDLQSHVHRVIALYYSNDAEATYGALLDLFIVLDKSGFRLRQRLLNKLAPRLKSEQRIALRNALMFGIKTLEDVPHSPYSCFGAELHDMGGVVVQTGEQITHEFSALDEARDLIDSGFLDEARLVLEEAILASPEDAELNDELLNLFRYTKDRDAFFNAVDRFADLPLAAADAWAELKMDFGEQQGA